MTLSDAGLDGVQEHAVVWLRQLDAGKQVGNDAFKQRDVLSTHNSQLGRHSEIRHAARSALVAGLSVTQCDAGKGYLLLCHVTLVPSRLLTHQRADHRSVERGDLVVPRTPLELRK